MDKKPYTPPYELTSKILDSVEQIGERLGRLKADTPTTTVPKLRRGNRIKTIQASLEIEGNTLSVQQVTAIFRLTVSLNNLEFDWMFRSSSSMCQRLHSLYIAYARFFTQLTSDVAIHATPALLITCTMWPLMMLQ